MTKRGNAVVARPHPCIVSRKFALFFLVSSQGRFSDRAGNWINFQCPLLSLRRQLFDEHLLWRQDIWLLSTALKNGVLPLNWKLLLAMDKCLHFTRCCICCCWILRIATKLKVHCDLKISLSWWNCAWDQWDCDSDLRFVSSIGHRDWWVRAKKLLGMELGHHLSFCLCLASLLRTSRWEIYI